MRFGEFLMSAAMMNMASQDLENRLPGIGPQPYMFPIAALSRALQEAPVLNNIHISNSQIGVLNTGTVANIDAFVSNVRGTDAEAVGSAVRAFAQAVVNSQEIDDTEKNAVLELVEALSDEVLKTRRGAAAKSLMRAILDRLQDVTTLLAAGELLGQAIEAVFK
jgi:hypothetical protein